jgi:hypothetical protein
MANKLTYKDTIVKHIAFAITSNYDSNKFLLEHIHPLDFLPVEDRKKRIRYLNIELYDRALKLNLLQPEMFDVRNQQFNESYFFNIELSNSIFIRCNSEQEFNELNELISQFPNEKPNYFTEQFCWFMKETFKKYEIVKNLELVLRMDENQYKKGISSNRLKEIWLAEAKISVEDFLKRGVEKGMWDEKNNIILKRASPFGTNKTFLASLSVALKGYSISSNIDHKLIGEVLCETFHINIKTDTDNPFKSFESGNPEYIKLLKKQFGVI